VLVNFQLVITAGKSNCADRITRLGKIDLIEGEYFGQSEI
jgi:hypothetical protein